MIVALAFVRLITHPTLSDHPFTARPAEAAVQQWWDCDHVRLLGSRDFERFFPLLDEAGLGCNLTTGQIDRRPRERIGRNGAFDGPRLWPIRPRALAESALNAEDDSQQRSYRWQRGHHAVVRPPMVARRKGVR